MRMFGILVAVLVLGGVLACSRSSVPAPVEPGKEAAAMGEKTRIIEHFAGRGEVRLAGRSDGPVFPVEVARTEGELAQGLMFRRTLAENHGMLFRMPYDRDWTFYMRNTYVRLDMVFIDAQWVVAGVIANVPPLTEDLRSVGRPSRYVLELPAHEAERHGIVKGTRMSFSELPDAAPPTAQALAPEGTP